MRPISYTEKEKGIVKFLYSKEDYKKWNDARSSHRFEILDFSKS